MSADNVALPAAVRRAGAWLLLTAGRAPISPGRPSPQQQTRRGGMRRPDETDGRPTVA